VCGLQFFAVAVSFLLASILPLTCAGQKITTIDPNAASSKSVEDLSKASLSSSQLHADPPELVERAEKKDFTRELSLCNGVLEIESICMWSSRQE